MTRKHKPAPGEFYHIYNRGVDKRDIFLSQPDYQRFMTLLYLCNGTSRVDVWENKVKSLHEMLIDPEKESIVDICTYCLMPNHFHLLVYEKNEGGVSKFMQKLLTGYTMYFNKKYDRTGALFQGSYKSSFVNNDQYLSYLITYIHLNPVKLIEPDWKEVGVKEKVKVNEYLKKYPYSAFLDYSGIKRVEVCLIEKSRAPVLAKNPVDFEKNLQIWLSKEGLTSLGG